MHASEDDVVTQPQQTHTITQTEATLHSYTHNQGDWHNDTHTHNPYHNNTLRSTLTHSRIHCFVQLSRTQSVVTDFGRSIGKPSARSHTSCDSTPNARETPKSTV
jgi:hypothetical protein